MNLLIDIGNSRVKMAVMRSDASEKEVVEQVVSSDFEMCEVEALAAKYDLRRAIVSSTRGDAGCVAEALAGVVGDVLLFDDKTSIPIANSYSTPETLGRDRLAAAVGATVLSSARNQLIIDMGTAITIDLVTERGGFEGGVISPGLGMRFRALHEFTASLPLCSVSGDFDGAQEAARSTREAIERGVVEGIMYEIGGHIAKNRAKYCEIDVIFAGGDLKYFDKRIKNTIFAATDLVFVGLNRILNYNAKN